MITESTENVKDSEMATTASTEEEKAAMPGAKEKTKNKKVGIVCMIAAVLAVAVIAVVLIYSLRGHRSVKIEQYDGDVEMERSGKEKDLFEGLKLIADDKVTTGEDGKVELLIDTDKHLVAAENTCFSVNAAGNADSGKVTIDLEYGSALATIDEKLSEDSEFEIETPNCTCSVRGTVFEVAYDKETRVSRIGVQSGVVRVKAGNGTLDLQAGESAIVEDEGISKTMIFGVYEQDGDLSNGPEPIEWDILGQDENGTVLISHYILEHHPYHDTPTDVTWENSTLRQWLNDDFYNEAFSAEEQGKIRTVTNSNPDNPEHGTPGGNDTNDKVFLLSREEVQNCWNMEEAAAAKGESYFAHLDAHGTVHAALQGGYEAATYYPAWWLRTPGADASSAGIYGEEGSTPLEDGNFVVSNSGVRPVIILRPDESGTEPVAGEEAGTSEDKGNPPYENEEGYIVFGTYEQDNDESNGPEPIEWVILDQKDDSLFVVSRYVLCEKQYHQVLDEAITWETCSLRAWLNDEFLDTAFTKAEQAWINVTKVETMDAPTGNRPGGNATEDKIFLLSVDEVLKYYPMNCWNDDKLEGNSEYVLTAPTEYAREHGASCYSYTEETYEECKLADSYSFSRDMIGREAAWWWLRSPYTESNRYACYVGVLGYVGWHCNPNQVISCGVRPAMWISFRE